MAPTLTARETTHLQGEARPTTEPPSEPLQKKAKTDAAPASVPDPVSLPTLHDVRTVLDQWLSKHRASTDTFQNPSAMSSTITLTDADVERVRICFCNDTLLGHELWRLLNVGVGTGAKQSSRWHAREIARFRGLLHVHRSQGTSYILGSTTTTTALVHQQAVQEPPAKNPKDK